jgi:hypothetical protein
VLLQSRLSLETYSTFDTIRNDSSTNIRANPNSVQSVVIIVVVRLGAPLAAQRLAGSSPLVRFLDGLSLFRRFSSILCGRESRRAQESNNTARRTSCSARAFLACSSRACESGIMLRDSSKISICRQLYKRWFAHAKERFGWTRRYLFADVRFVFPFFLPLRDFLLLLLYLPLVHLHFLTQA